MAEYGYANQGAAAAPNRTATETDHIVSRFLERLEGLRNVAKRLDALSDRLAGPRPRELSKEAQTVAAPGVQPFAHRVNNIDAQMSAVLADCQNALGALEAFV